MAGKSVEKITVALLTAMETCNFQEITISEIADLAGTARKTFYNHFKTKEEVLSLLCQGIIDEYIEKSAPFYSSLEGVGEGRALELAENFFTINKKHGGFFTLLFQQNLFYLYAQALQLRVINSPIILNLQLIDQVDAVLQPYVIPSYTASILQLYETWYQRGFQESPHEMANIYLKIVHNMP